MRHKSRYAPQAGGPRGAIANTKQQGLNTRTLATGHCYCGYLAYHNVPKLCATCARFDRYAREVELRRLVGYVGFAL